MSEFVFNPKTHRYYLDGKQMTGVTTILGVIAKPQLISWASNQAVDYIKDNYAKAVAEKIEEAKSAGKKIDVFEITNIYNDSFTPLLDEARTAYAKKRDKAADLGTAVHEEIEQYIKCRMHGIDFFSDNEQVNHFKAWAEKYDVEFIASEEQVYSEKLFVAGTYDFACIIDGRKYLGDLKTANGLYPEYFYQCAAYRMMAEEMGQTDFAGSILVRIGRDGKFNEDEDVIISYGYEEEKQAFLSALTLYRVTERYETKRKGSKAL